MIDQSRAREIAAGWISPSWRDENLTAFATGHPRWTADGLADEVARELSYVLGNPERFEDPIECRDELRLLLEWVRVNGEHAEH